MQCPLLAKREIMSKCLNNSPKAEQAGNITKEDTRGAVAGTIKDQAPQISVFFALLLLLS